jgi:spermidine synthase
MSEPDTSCDDSENERSRFLECEPFVYRTESTLSLHFDISVVQSEMRRDAPEELLLAYTRTMMGFLLFNPRPEKVLMIGLGGGSIPKYCYARLPETSIFVVEINPQVIALRDTFFVPGNDARFQVICQDGADFVRNAPGTCDVLLIDGFDIAGQSPQLCSQRFYDDCYRRLTPGGLMVVNLGGGGPHEGALVSRIRRSFKSAIVVVESEDLANRIAFARKGKALTLTREQFVDRLDQLEADHPVSLRCTLDRLRYAQFKALAASLVGAVGDNAGR